MHDIQWIRDNPSEFDRLLSRRNLDDEERRRFSSANILSIDARRRAIVRVHEGALTRRKAASKENEAARRDKDEAAIQRLRDEVLELKTTISTTEKEEKDTAKELHELLAQIPNLPLDNVPDGVDEQGNVQRHVFGKIRNYAINPRPHDDLGGALGYMDFETAAKLSGARFVVLKKGLARLERALGQFFLDVHTQEHGYTEVNPPLLVRDDAMFGTGQLPKFKDDQFSAISLNLFEESSLAAISRTASANTVIDVAKSRPRTSFDIADGTPTVERYSNLWKQLKKFSVTGGSVERLLNDYGNSFARLAIKKSEENRRWLIPTAEVSLTNLVRESILDEKELPLRFTALTPCFRAEAGAAGRDTRGMIRQHQFTKVELVSITTPEASRDEHERMLSSAEEVLRRLDLHYRVMTLCAGDMGFSAQKTWDIEVWMPGQGEGGAYREISSCSVCGDFQALNGSGTAVGRALIAVMETYQQEDGSIAVPDVLQPYMGGVKLIEKEK